MAIFPRFRRSDNSELLPPPAPRELLPHINQRVTVLRAGHPPVPSRVEDEHPGFFTIASPNFALADGEQIVVSWESEDGWYSLESVVERVTEDNHLPTVDIASRGRLSRHNDRRGDLRVSASRTLSVRPVLARVVKPGRTLDTHTVEISAKAISFTTSAPFAPGDIVESTLELGEGVTIGARLKIIRVDAATDSWRQVCTAMFDEILRSDRAMLMTFLESQQGASAPTAPIGNTGA
jgi:hypothetical protein